MREKYRTVWRCTCSVLAVFAALVGGWLLAEALTEGDLGAGMAALVMFFVMAFLAWLRNPPRGDDDHFAEWRHQLRQ